MVLISFALNLETFMEGRVVGWAITEGRGRSGRMDGWMVMSGKDLSMGAKGVYN